MRSYARFAWGLLAYNLLVIVWGAFVRATGSGAGCGEHWPLCNGEVLPRARSVETAIEFTHRLTSGLALVGVVILVVMAVRAFPRGHAARRAAWGSLVLMLVEAALGAGLVLFGWVAQDDSAARGWVMAVHLVNTFLLLGALALAAALADRPRGVDLRGHGALAAVFLVSLAAMLLTGATGAVAALGDTLYPATSFAEGLRQELAADARVLLRLRVVHPFAAIGASIVALAFARAAPRLRREPHVESTATALTALVVVQLCAGGVNVILLAPVWMQLVHLLLADLVWIVLVVLGASTFAAAERAPLRAPAPLAAGLPQA